MSRRGGCICGRERFVVGRGRGGRRNFNIGNNQNKRQELKFYLHGNRQDQQTENFTKVKEHIILNIQSKSVNGSDITESILKGAIYI